MSGTYKVVVIIVTHNGSEHISGCLDQFSALDPLEIEIIVIDNASDDDTVSKVKTNYSSVRCIELDENIGFGRGNNLGLQYALQKDVEFVLLLNQDARIDAEALSDLINIHREHPEFGILSPLHLFDDERLDRNFGNYLKDIRPDFFEHVLLKKELDAVYELPFVNAAIWLLPAECIEAVGGFDPLFDHFGEDNDFVRRMHYHGYKCGICPAVHAYHNREQKRSWPSYGQYIRTKDLVRLKDLDRPFHRQVLSFLGRSMQRWAYFISKGKGSNFFASVRNFFSLAALLPTVRKHRIKCRKRGRTFLMDD